MQVHVFIVLKCLSVFMIVLSIVVMYITHKPTKVCSYCNCLSRILLFILDIIIKLCLIGTFPSHICTYTYQDLWNDFVRKNYFKINIKCVMPLPHRQMYTSIWWYLRVLPVLHRPEVVDIGVNTIYKNMPHA